MTRLLALVLVAAPAYAHDIPRRVSAERVDVVELKAAEGDHVRMQSTNGALALVVDPSVKAAVLTAKVNASGSTRADAERELDRIEVTFVRRGDVLVAEVEIDDSVHGGADLTLRVPDADAADLDTDNGAVDASGVDGDLTVVTANGAVDVRDVDGRVTVETRNGAIHVRGAAGPLDLDTSNGRVFVEDAGSSVSASTSNGSIEVHLRPDAPGPVDLRTSNGSVELSVGPGFSGVVSAGTTMGSVRVDDRAGRATSRDGVWLIGEGGERSRVESKMGAVSIEIGG